MKNVSLDDCILADVIAEDPSLTEADRAELTKVSNYDNASRKQFSHQRKAVTANPFRRAASDVGSLAVQVGVFTERIRATREHLETGHRQDKFSKRNLERLMNQRRYKLILLKRKHWPTYSKVVTSLGINEFAEATSHAVGTQLQRPLVYPLRQRAWLTQVPDKIPVPETKSRKRRKKRAAAPAKTEQS